MSHDKDTTTTATDEPAARAYGFPYRESDKFAILSIDRLALLLIQLDLYDFFGYISTMTLHTLREFYCRHRGEQI